MTHNTDKEIKAREYLLRIESRNRRASVSAEVYGANNRPPSTDEFPSLQTFKSEEEIVYLRELFQNTFLLSNLEEEPMLHVIHAVEPVQVARGATVIQQGDDGDAFFVVESGSLIVLKRKGGETKQVLTYGKGGAFGELALLYNCPRAASVIADDDCVLWRLDRTVFNHIVKGAAFRKRERHERMLAKVPLLESLDPYHWSTIADALKTQTFNAGEIIIDEGDVGNRFYFMENGGCQAYKTDLNGKQTDIFNYVVGDYFGELALLHDAPRAATVVASSKAEVSYLERDAFTRLLGPLSELLEAHAAEVYRLPRGPDEN